MALRHQSEEEQAAYISLAKKDKRLKAEAYCLQRERKQFLSSVQSGSYKERWTKEEEWESETPMKQKWTDSELEARLCSGRIVWRNALGTDGVYEYQGIMKWKKNTDRERGAAYHL